MRPILIKNALSYEMMDNYLEEIVDKIGVLNPVHAKKLSKNFKQLNNTPFVDEANVFLHKYNQFLKSVNKDFDYSIDCYLKMLADVTYEQIRFIETGKYSSTSFKEVNERVYSNPDVMEYYMHALLLSQFLWKHHYQILNFFRSCIDIPASINNYLEIGAGHGLYLNEAVKNLGDNSSFDVVDISPSSIEISKRFVESDKVNFVLSDIFDYKKENTYDFITMGEVLEHVEQPVQLLKRLNVLLKDGGYAFITTPANAPAIDHIYLFENADDIRNVIKASGFSIVQELAMYVEDVPEEIAKKMKITLMYGALLKK